LGPLSRVSVEGVSLSAGPDILVRLWLGNLLLATVSAAIAYVVAIRLVTEFRQRVRQGEVPLILMTVLCHASESLCLVERDCVE